MGSTIVARGKHEMAVVNRLTVEPELAQCLMPAQVPLGNHPLVMDDHRRGWALRLDEPFLCIENQQATDQGHVLLPNVPRALVGLHQHLFTRGSGEPAAALHGKGAPLFAAFGQDHLGLRPMPQVGFQA